MAPPPTKTHRKKHNSPKIKGSVNPLSDARRVCAKEASCAEATTGIGEETRPKQEQQHDGTIFKKKRKFIIVEKDNNGGVNKTEISSGSQITKADLKARELWHKKSGAGYSFFVQYYASQPRGIVTNHGKEHDYDKYENMEITNGPYNKVTSASAKKQGGGQSRASKKRRKKKKPNNNGNDNNNIDKDDEKEIPSSQSNTSAKANMLRSTGEDNDYHQELLLSPQLQHAMQHQKHNAKHLRYFLASMSKELPLTFRIRQCNKNKIDDFKRKLETEFSHLIRAVPYNDKTTNSCTIYQATPDSNLSKTTLGKMSPELKSLILDSSASGLIARQELGSMLPVIALKGGNFMSYGSKVLDLCASPGSKTLQALEIVASSSIPSDNDDDTKSDKKSRKPGRVVANDIHPLRIESLKDAISRSGLPTTLTDRIIFTNHDASVFPTPKSGKLFDCIIADVPCSGDGTIRKDPRILSGWMPSISNSLHSIQKKILKRAIELVRVGGVVAYSTCSLNPVEDEAVVASVLSWSNKYGQNSSEGGRTKSETNGKRYCNTNKVELLEWPSDVLSRLKRSKGVRSWRVANYVDESKMNDLNDSNRIDIDDMPQIQWYESFEQAIADRVPHAAESMFPPLEKYKNEMKLDRCLRLLPQDNDTGGFFVALLRRVS